MFNRIVRPLSRSRGRTAATDQQQEFDCNVKSVDFRTESEIASPGHQHLHTDAVIASNLKSCKLHREHGANASCQNELTTNFSKTCVDETKATPPATSGYQREHANYCDLNMPAPPVRGHNSAEKMLGVEVKAGGGTVSKSTSKDSALNIDVSLPASCSCSRVSLCSSIEAAHAVDADELSLLKAENGRLRYQLQREKDRLSRLSLLEAELETIRSSYNDLRISADRSERMQHLLRGKLEVEIARLRTNATTNAAAQFPAGHCDSCSKFPTVANDAAGLNAATDAASKLCSNINCSNSSHAASLQQNMQLRALCGRYETRQQEHLSQLQQQASALEQTTRTSNTAFYEERCRLLQERCDQLEHVRHAFVALQASTKMREQQEAEVRSQLQSEIENLRAHIVVKSSSASNSRLSLVTNTSPVEQQLNNNIFSDAISSASNAAAQQQQLAKALPGGILSRSEGFLHHSSHLQHSHTHTPNAANVETEDGQQQQSTCFLHFPHSASMSLRIAQVPATTGGLPSHLPIELLNYHAITTETVNPTCSSGISGLNYADHAGTLVDVDSIMTRVRMLEQHMAENDKVLAHLRGGSTAPAPVACAETSEIAAVVVHGSLSAANVSRNAVAVASRHRDPAFSAAIASHAHTGSTALQKEEHSRNASHLTFIMHHDEPDGVSGSSGAEANSVRSNESNELSVSRPPSFLDARYCADQNTLPIPHVSLSVQDAMLMQGVKWTGATASTSVGYGTLSAEATNSEQQQNDSSSILHRLRQEAGLLS